MAERFAPLGVEPLLAWVLAEEKRGQIFGIHRDLFFQSTATDPFRMTRFGRLLETPLGTAAGPHTQLAQNIVSAWLCGARFIELKTVQTLDRLEVRKPCIAVAEAGFNCEWSQELTLDESFTQYLAAWVLLHALKRRLYGPFRGDPGFIFNFSVGYDLAGIMQPNMQRFFEKISSCRDAKEAMVKELAPLYPGIRKIDIPDRVSDNVTLSTMHGCPPEEIEKIGLYLLNEKKLHTTVKLNPTLLGPETLRGLLNDRLGWKVRVPDQAFAHDLKYDAALDLLRSLQACADKNGLNFSVKLTNTLECLNERGLLPEAEKTVYMSGRPLHPIAVALARRLQDDFAGRLDISFSAGTDCFNAAELLACGLKPLTVCSDLLRPGGYARLGQYMDEIRRSMKACRAMSLDDLVLKRAKANDPVGAVLKNLKNYEVALAEDENCCAQLFPAPSFKGKRPLEWFDCAAAPCREACAVGQDVSRYMHWVGRGDADQAAAVIWETNPLPAVCGMVCDQKCRSRCTRGQYDRSLAIRAVKRFAIENGKIPDEDSSAAGDATRIAVVGAGPSGLAAARDLVQAGFWVEVFEADGSAGGLAAKVIPGFRLGAKALPADVSRLEELGVIFHYGQAVDARRLQQLLEAYEFVYSACGAGKGRKILIPGEDAAGVYDALEFLAALKRGEKPDLGRQVLVIGGGNSAMDAARSARRLCGTRGLVTVVYRRSLAQMPAAFDEIHEALAEGVKILELTAPLRIETANGREWALLCSRMELRGTDESGRSRPVPISDSEFELTCDAVIVAIGQEKNTGLPAGTEWKADGDDGRTTHPRLFIGGDAASGASTLIQAVADGCRAMGRIMEKSNRTIIAAKSDPLADLTWAEHQLMRSHREAVRPLPAVKAAPGRNLFKAAAGLDSIEARREAKRCLHCDDLCQLCVSVCPNRALVAFETVPRHYPVLQAVKLRHGAELSAPGFLELRQKYQLVHIVDFCNACGNCTAFCPTSGAPYKDKPHFYLHKNGFEQAVDGFLLEPPRPGGVRVLRARVNGEGQQLRQYPDRLEFENRNCLLKLRRNDFSFQAADWRLVADPVFDGKLLAQMIALLEFLPLFLHGDKTDV